ncbi:MAG: type II toxin-antitoxin system VapC family toxin [Paludibacteraceae bacterium]|nr:type II toxin-antitoxin system VapC family toxin [Paludibacteraceae bacterium]
MRYLLDTCTFLFATTEPELLGKEVRNLFDDYDNEFCISIETVRELIIAFKNKGLKFRECQYSEDIIHTIKNVLNITILPVKEEHMQTFATLDINVNQDHRDPSDHVIIAHAITNKMPLISCDRKFQFYTKQGLDLISYRRGG